MKILLSLFLIGILGHSFAVAVTPTTDQPSNRIVFTGDISLSREVLREIETKHYESPWRRFTSFFSSADWVVGNLEGAVGNKKDCSTSELCFYIPKEMIPLLKGAGFNAMGIENNHSADLGDVHRKTTYDSLTTNSLTPLNYAESPGFLRLGQHNVAVITLSQVGGKDGKKVEIPSYLLRQKLRLAKSLANWVVVYLHWGAELADWPQNDQRTKARWLIENGADLIIGHHSHVVQDPECILGKPVFFSLGNHVFDQKYPLTKRGLIADCSLDHEKLKCKGVATQTPDGTSYPILTESSTSVPCSVPASPLLQLNGYTLRPRAADHEYVRGKIILEGSRTGMKTWDTVAKTILAVIPARLKAEDSSRFLVTLEQHPSSIDQEIGPRPYVYEVTPRGLIARWRGSALAWPLLDIQLMRDRSKKDYLCALHRRDSFLMLDNHSKQTRTALYQWNGFGFAGVRDQILSQECEQIWKIE